MIRALSEGRQRGRIEERRSSLRVVVYAGMDPVTGKRSYLRETIQGTDKAAYKRANSKLHKLLSQVDEQQTTTSNVSLEHALEEWMRVTEIEDSTRKAYRGYIDRTIRPALGTVAVSKVNPRMLESLYTELRRCRTRCDGKSFIERHRKTGEHDCAAEQCQVHACKPMAASTVQQVHSIISGMLSAAQRWGWITSNPARIARTPRRSPPQPDPPTSRDAARLAKEAFRMDDDWGMLVWLTMMTGIRRGELCGLRFARVDLDAELIDLRRSWVGGKEKDTKTHQNRRIALDTETVVLLKEHRARVKQRVEALGLTFSDALFVFSGSKTPDHSQPYSPNAITQRYKDMAARLGIKTHLHALRHYSATELLSAGVDLRTVAGRLGHGGGGVTTLRVYAAWVAASDRKAAEILGSRVPKRQRKSVGDTNG